MTQASVRTERDPLGEKQIPRDALHGVQTARARENFVVSRLRIHPALVTAYAEIKRAAAEANMRLGKLDPASGRPSSAPRGRSPRDSGATSSTSTCSRPEPGRRTT